MYHARYATLKEQAGYDHQRWCPVDEGYKEFTMPKKNDRQLKSKMQELKSRLLDAMYYGVPTLDNPTAAKQQGQGLVDYTIILVGLVFVVAIVAAIALPMLADTAIMEGLAIFTDLM